MTARCTRPDSLAPSSREASSQLLWFALRRSNCLGVVAFADLERRAVLKLFETGDHAGLSECRRV